MPTFGDHAGRDELKGLLRAVLERAVAELRSGWRLQYDAVRNGEIASLPPGAVAAILTHAEFGVAMVDVVPRIAPPDRPGTPTEDFRHRLASGGLKQSLLRTLPIVHLSVTPARIDRLEEILAYAFSWERAFTAASDPGWTDRVAEIVSAPPPNPIAGLSRARQAFASPAWALRAAGWLPSSARR